MRGVQESCAELCLGCSGSHAPGLGTDQVQRCGWGQAVAGVLCAEVCNASTRSWTRSTAGLKWSSANPAFDQDVLNASRAALAGALQQHGCSRAQSSERLRVIQAIFLQCALSNHCYDEVCALLPAFAHMCVPRGWHDCVICHLHLMLVLTLAALSATALCYQVQRYDQRFAVLHTLPRPDPLFYDQYLQSIEASTVNVANLLGHSGEALLKVCMTLADVFRGLWPAALHNAGILAALGPASCTLAE